MTDEEVARRLGRRVRRIRELRGWTQAELSRRTDERGLRINRPNISRVESGRYGSIPITRTILRLACALEVQPTTIFGALDDPPSHMPSSTHAPETWSEPENSREEHSE